MPPLPRVSGRDAVAAFEKAGFQVARQRGSHIMMSRPGWPATLSIPNHQQLRAGTLRSLIRSAGLTVDEFRELLK